MNFCSISTTTSNRSIHGVITSALSIAISQYQRFRSAIIGSSSQLAAGSSGISLSSTSTLYQSCSSLFCATPTYSLYLRSKIANMSICSATIAIVLYLLMFSSCEKFRIPPLPAFCFCKRTDSYSCHSSTTSSSIH